MRRRGSRGSLPPSALRPADGGALKRRVYRGPGLGGPSVACAGAGAGVLKEGSLNMLKEVLLDVLNGVLLSITKYTKRSIKRSITKYTLEVILW